jgi:glucosylceramidase
VRGADSELRINPAERYQTIDGFGASIAYMQGEVFQMKEPYRTQALDLLFKDLGATILRIRVDNTTAAAKDQYQFAKDKAQVWTAQQAVKRGIKTVIASSWSAPAWMKDNNQLQDGGHVKPECYQDIANWYVAYLKQYREKFGLPIDYVSFTNEPDFSGAYDSMNVTPDEYLSIAKMIAGSLKKAGIPTKLFGPETEGTALAVSNYAPKILGDDSPMGLFGVHTYAANNLPELAKIQPTYKVPVWVTEYSKLNKDKETGIDESLTIARHIHDVLTIGNANAFLYWGYWWDSGPQGLITASGFDSYFEPSKRYYMFKQFAKFVRPGAVRIGASATGTGLQVSAYENGSNLTMVVINKSAAAQKLNLVVPGNADLTVYMTSEDKDCVPSGKVSIKNGQPTPFNVPARAILTLTGDWTYDKSAVKPVATSPKENTATPAAPASGTKMLLTGFENEAENQAGLDTYNGPKSTVKADVVSDIAHDGKFAVKVTFDSNDWIGALWTLTPKTGDWTGMNNISYWVYTDAAKTSFNPVVEDAGMEQFMGRSPITLNGTGWHQVVIPLSQFASRTDYQNKGAKINGSIDFPVHSFHFLATIYGKGSLYIDQIEVTP